MGEVTQRDGKTSKARKSECRLAERREWGNRIKFPFKDSNGDLIPSNRRRIVERRLQAIKTPETQGAQGLKLVAEVACQNEEIVSTANTDPSLQDAVDQVSVMQEIDERVSEAGGSIFVNEKEFKQTMQAKIKQEQATECRRENTDRRCMLCQPLFPFMDGNGDLVRGERRTTDDRRENYTDVEWLV